MMTLDPTRYYLIAKSHISSLLLEGRAEPIRQSEMFQAMGTVRKDGREWLRMADADGRVLLVDSHSFDGVLPE